jgi:hypothetical protein
MSSGRAPRASANDSRITPPHIAHDRQAQAASRTSVCRLASSCASLTSGTGTRRMEPLRSGLPKTLPREQSMYRQSRRGSRAVDQRAR